MRKLVLVTVLMISLVFVGCSSDNGNTISIGGKDYVEQDILVYITGELIEAQTDLEVNYRNWLGGTNVVDGALHRGDLDMYVEYTGTALINLLDLDLVNDPQQAYDIVADKYDEMGVKWLKPLGFNNTYVLSMREDRAEELGVEKVSDLKEHADELILGATHEFLERSDGYQGLQEAYGFEFGDTAGFDPGLTYAAVRDGNADVNDAFATDGRIMAFNLKMLEDDKNFFPPYYAAPIVRHDTLEEHPELEEVLNMLAGRIDDETMSSLNGQVDLDGEEPRDVARDWLESEGLLE
ncbi:glycine betaine ABC transporter substrate-binding protein [Proteinivorax hydrogeniformans]|uniref:Glycine betaine ABC transporter substrate-binding protein n=1 Tax=Proteinivorax hydrogeniformans TaxID=1826727 RepID=A0AAU8HVQ0_9FIRM